MSIKERNLLFRALKEAGIFPNFIQEANKYAAMAGESAIENIMSSSFNYVIAYVGVVAQSFSDVLCKYRDNFLEEW